MSRIRPAVLAAVLLAVLALAGCGGGADEGSAEAWAGDVCSSVNGWFTAVDGALEGLTDEGLQMDSSDIEDAVGAVEDATAELGDELDQLEPLETEAGNSAEEVITDLRETLRDEVEAIEGVLDGTAPPLEGVSTVAGALASAADALQESYDALRELDAGGELEAAFEDADGCNALREQLSELGG